MIMNRGADPDSVIDAIGRVGDPHSDLVAKLEKSLGWPNERLCRVVEQLSAEGRVGPILMGNDGGISRLVAFELKPKS